MIDVNIDYFLLYLQAHVENYNTSESKIWRGDIIFEHCIIINYIFIYTKR